MSAEQRLEELKDELMELKRSEEILYWALSYAEEAEDACRDVGIQPSHHAVMELEDCRAEIQDRIEEIELKVGEI